MIHYQLDGSSHAPLLVFSNSLGSDLSMWDWVLPRLRPHFQILRYDTRGHGQSVVTPGPYSLAQLGTDVIELLDRLQLGKAYFCGLSLGGLTGQWLGINHPNRFNKLVICNTAARIGTVEGWNDRIKNVQEMGVEAMASAILNRWLTEDYQKAHPDIVQTLLAMIGRNSDAGYKACCAALRDADLSDQIRQIPIPTLSIAGLNDLVTTVADGLFIAKEVPNAVFLSLPAAHLSAIEAADAFADGLLRFLNPNHTENFANNLSMTT